MIIKTLLFAGFRVTKGLPKGLPENDSARNVPNRVLYDFISRFLMVEGVQVLLSAEIKSDAEVRFYAGSGVCCFCRHASESHRETALYAVLHGESMNSFTESAAGEKLQTH